MGWFSNGKCNSTARLDGKTVVITGCNAGIGKYTVLDMYKRGARVLMVCRDLSRAEAARDWVMEQASGAQGAGKLGHLEVQRLDLSSLASVRECARTILAKEAHLHILINNAGVMLCPRSLTEDGYELQFATNHLGHFLFTLLLLPRIIASAPARILNLSSIAHVLCNSMYFDDINMEKFYHPRKAYSRSKMANILFTRELAKRLTGTGVTVYSLHPGVVNTELSRHMDAAMFPGARWLYHTFGDYFMKTPEQGAQTTLYCAVDEETANQTGLYYDDCKVKKPTAMALDDDLARRLWDVSLDMVGLTPEPPFDKTQPVS